jgi:O-acetyl-ADP-ribose deacetylase (regulator of RNase III)
MIKYIVGNILDSPSPVLVNPVNTVGVMGKGLALQFKTAYPNNFYAYSQACKAGVIGIGKLFVFPNIDIFSGSKLIINFPTKKDWRKPSEYRYIEEGLDDLMRIIDERGIKEIAIPPLGAGLGGLEWGRVKQLIENKMASLADVKIWIYEPTLKL